MMLWQNIAVYINIYGFRTVYEGSSEEECTMRILVVVERAQTLISDDPGQSLRKLASIVGVS